MRVVVLISGTGTNLQALIDTQNIDPEHEIVGVVSNEHHALGLERARRADIPTIVISHRKYDTREDFDEALASVMHTFDPIDLVVLAGWMRKLTMNFLGEFPNKVINLHPALPGQFPGTNAIERAWEAYKAGDVSTTGVMVHLVPDEGIDDGPVLLAKTVTILETDTLKTLTERIHKVEHRLLVQAVKRFNDGAQPS